MPERATRGEPALLRALGVRDGALITIGAVLGTAIFLTPGAIARALPHPGLILAAWLAGGLLTVAGALTYAEMGAMLPRAGGIYHFLSRAYGKLPAFLFGWASFFVIMSGGIAALAVGFGEHLGAFLPFLSRESVLISIPVGQSGFRVTGSAIAAVAAIAFLTALNVLGLRKGAGFQNAVTIAKVGALALLAGVGLSANARVRPDLTGDLPSGNLFSFFAVAMIAILWAYDGWYVVVFSAGEMRDPGRSLPRGLIAGTVAVAAIYLAINFVYLRTLSLPEMAATDRAGEAAALALFGPSAGRIVSAAILLAIFGCLAANILCCARIYQPMAEDGLFFKGLARINPRHRTPAASLIAQGIWSACLALTGSYEQLFTYVVFIEMIFFAAAGAALYVLRRKDPELPRPYRTWGYPVVPAVFVLSSLWIAGNTLIEKPLEALAGSGLLLAGLPAYLFWKRRASLSLPETAKGGDGSGGLRSPV